MKYLKLPKLWIFRVRPSPPSQIRYETKGDNFLLKNESRWLSKSGD